MTNPGTIYFFVNPAMPGLVKVGRTAGSIEQRIKQLSSTGIPQPFQVIATFHVCDAETCEKAVHSTLNMYRPNKNREFFEGSVSELLQKTIHIISSFLSPADNSTIKALSVPVVDEDDIYFMTFLLHDGYQQGTYINTEELVQHHTKYAPLELEYKLLKLADLGMIERSARNKTGLSSWRIAPSGLKFMFESGNVLYNLIAEERPNAQQGHSS